MRHRRRARTFIIASTLTLVFTACSEDDGATVREIDSDSSSASGSASGSASALAAADRPCEPVGEDLADQASSTVEVELADYEFIPDDVTVDAGVVTFATTNTGNEAHELAFLPGGGDVPTTADGAPDEEALAAAGAFELEAYGPGQSCDATFELEPGTYTTFCIIAAPDGETHYAKGMRGTVTAAQPGA